MPAVCINFSFSCLLKQLLELTENYTPEVSEYKVRAPIPLAASLNDCDDKPLC